MKKKIFMFIMAFAIIFPVAFLLSACCEPDNYYYTIKTPENCTFFVNSSASDKKGSFVNKGREFDGQVKIEPGYEVSGELILKVNGKVVEWTNIDETRSYFYFNFTPTEDFDIEIEGTIVESVYEVRFIEGENADVSEFSDLYIRFEGEEEQTVEDFLSTTDVNQNFKYNESLKFYVYTKGYKGEPNLSFTPGILGEFYKDVDKDEYGYVYDAVITEDVEVEIYGTIPSNLYFVRNADESSSSITTEQLEMYVDDNNNVIIKFGENISQETISQLTLTINGEQQDVSLVEGENTIKIKPAYEYISEDGMFSPYHYTIDLNFYDFPEFNEQI